MTRQYQKALISLLFLPKILVTLILPAKLIFRSKFDSSSVEATVANSQSSVVVELRELLAAEVREWPDLEILSPDLLTLD